MVDVCPFDGLPCEFVSSCDDVIDFAFDEVPKYRCSRVVLKNTHKELGSK